MKMLTAVSALEAKVVKPTTRIEDSAVIRFGPTASATPTAGAWAGSPSGT